MTVIFLILVLVILPAVAGYALYLEDFGPETASWWLGSLARVFHAGIAPGDYLIYRKSKVSTHPGPRAINVEPAGNGDDYHYEVEKYWTVADILDDGRLVALTRTGKRIFLTAEDERLRKAGLIQRLRYRRRFPSL